MKTTLQVVKAAQFYSPHKVVQQQPDVATLDVLAVLPSLDTAAIARHRAELPAHLAKATGVSQELSPLAWWKLSAASLPT